MIFSPPRVKAVGLAADGGGNGFSGESSSFKIARDDDVKSRAFGGNQSAGESGLFTTEGGEGWIGLALPATSRIPFTLAMPQNQDSGLKLVRGFNWHNPRG